MQKLTEHEIHFVQPTSPLSVRLKLTRGGWVLSQSGDRHASFDTFGDAKFFASKLPSVPNRWSVDNPLNAHLLETL
jgi:hypothetical protein